MHSLGQVVRVLPWTYIREKWLKICHSLGPNFASGAIRAATNQLSASFALDRSRERSILKEATPRMDQ
jgi:hypothetical protein